MYIVNALRRAAQVAGQRVASVHEGRTRTWGELAARVARLAAVLRGAGAGPGERVALIGWNGDRYLEAVLAAAWARTVLVPLNTRLAAPEIEYQLNHAEARLLVYDADFEAMASSMSGKVESLRAKLALGEDTDARIEAAEPLEDAVPLAGDAIGIFYTGGTTGLPKGVMCTHANVAHQTSLHMMDLGWDGATRYLHVLPMFHLGGLLAAYCLTSLAGEHRYMARFDAGEFLRRCAQERITAAALGPVVVGWLLEHPRLAAFDLGALRSIAYGTAPMPEPVLARAIEKLPGVQFTQIYGQTEVTGTISVLRPDEHASPGRLRSAGRASWGVDVRIVDERGCEVPRGELGEIVARSPGVMAGYWRDPAQTAAAIRDGWLHTGDVGSMDAEGFIYVLDRRKDMIVTGGENVFSSEVERAIASCPGVAQVAVIGIPHESWGEAVHAVVVPAAGAKLGEALVLEHCRRLIAGFKCPKSVEIRADPLPVSGVAKIQKNVLREPYWKGRSRRVN